MRFCGGSTNQKGFDSKLRGWIMSTVREGGKVCININKEKCRILKHIGG
jgi:hypothetical protein